MMQPEEITRLNRLQKEYYTSGATRDVNFRKEQLRKLQGWIKLNEPEITGALYADLGKSRTEARMTEIGLVNEEIRHALRNIRKWTRPRRVHTSIVQFPSSARIFRDPYGAALILSPWNYPFMLSVSPLVAAIAAGNCVTLKPSAYSPATSGLLARMARECFAPEYVAVVEGGRVENASLLEEPYDKIFFTGSVAVGKVVMAAAAKNLTPITLELGGKSPCIVDETARIDQAAKRIVWGKFLNAGQTCVAPDYLLVHESVADKLIEKMIRYIGVFYGDHPESGDAFPKIITGSHFDRLMKLLSGAKILCGGQGNPASQRIAPTLVRLSGWEHPLMEEEIFGPILPILTYSSLDGAIRKISERPKPLAFYLFTRNAKAQAHVMETLPFGGGCVNDTVLQIASPTLPFGGVGSSGMGQYHGHYGFETFTRPKPILYKGRFDPPVRYPPYR